MKYTCNGVEHQLKGVNTDRKQFGEPEDRDFRQKPQIYVIQLCSRQGPDYSEDSVQNVTEEETQTELTSLLRRFKHLFDEPFGLPPSRMFDHKILLIPGSVPICSKPYRHPCIHKNEIERQVKEMLDTGVIKSSNSSYSSPVILVKKSDGTWRICIDYRKLNQNTVKDRFPIAIVEELFDELNGARYFSKLDLRSGYHQIRMALEDIYKTDFRTHEGLYEIKVMPFGLTSAPSIFQAMMNSILKNFLRKFVLVFFDHILIYNTSIEDHYLHLETFFKRLEENQLKIKRSKCYFMQRQVRYLGHIISEKGVEVDQEKIKTVLDWHVPKTLKELRGFLGLTGYYRRFIQGYGVIVGPLTNLLKKNSFYWELKAQEAFEKLKEALTQPPVLVMPDFNDEFLLECDAS